jgi:hypothetical protein
VAVAVALVAIVKLPPLEMVVWGVVVAVQHQMGVLKLRAMVVQDLLFFTGRRVSK